MTPRVKVFIPTVSPLFGVTLRDNSETGPGARRRENKPATAHRHRTTLESRDAAAACSLTHRLGLARHMGGPRGVPCDVGPLPRRPRVYACTLYRPRASFDTSGIGP